MKTRSYWLTAPLLAGIVAVPLALPPLLQNRCFRSRLSLPPAEETGASEPQVARPSPTSLRSVYRSPGSVVDHDQ